MLSIEDPAGIAGCCEAYKVTKDFDGNGYCSTEYCDSRSVIARGHSGE